MKPLAYGYMRVFHDATDEQLLSVEQRIKNYAEEHGFAFGGTFQEPASGSHATLNELIKKIGQTEAEYVIVPSLDDLSGNSILRGLLLDRLEGQAGVEVQELRSAVRPGTASSDTMDEPGSLPGRK
ncbi:recombinase family protein [Candidatus Protofrankia californiensis]|uniref:recombinase family protein n=1 Tax=Candidatus Protofrankia californiensis TaxID=1839754 RepID=UPI0013ED86C6|nr:recombinase family protein [Candidatus Protofrankia californiensis]